MRQNIQARAKRELPDDLSERKFYLFKLKKFQESKIIIYTNSSQKLHIGNQIKVCGKVSFYEEARNPGNFDQKFYYQKQGIHGKVRSDDIQITDYKRNKLKDRLEKFRMNWQKMLQREMGERDGSALAAILLGEKAVWIRK